ncbi:hypothetical protein BJ085DRAFT_31484 [Dimargaris cristalligena]|uniref:COP9 signalosome complex subunit 3 N-terminal helical repeats domain-containing protein n=1 Tax=Dimargaris cristalligena TaxID=215637 RepID=A0A4Q0A351_9FUNG|nr:hypothetical protein BJ085DRAFT_31484 [Dimargaris cristalligena]|eukprot:RKP40001.1 hypothetical protein BJ085DRAFT_31484 [Dimargaris cristalligena]
MVYIGDQPSAASYGHCATVLIPAIEQLDQTTPDVNIEAARTLTQFLSPGLADPSSKSDITVEDIIKYYYFAGLAYIAQVNYCRAKEYLTLCLVVPTIEIHPLQSIAYNKVSLVNLILEGQAFCIPKLCSSELLIVGPQSACHSLFCRKYPDLDSQQLRTILATHRASFIHSGDLELAQIAVGSVERHLLKKMARIYTCVPMSTLATALAKPQTEVSYATIAHILESLQCEGSAAIRIENRPQQCPVVHFLPSNINAMNQQAVLGHEIQRATRLLAEVKQIASQLRQPSASQTPTQPPNNASTHQTNPEQLADLDGVGPPSSEPLQRVDIVWLDSEDN